MQTTNVERQKLIKLYYSRKSVLAFLTIVLSLLFLAVTKLALITICLSAMYLFYHFKNKPSDSTIDQWMAEAFDGVAAKAKTKFELPAGFEAMEPLFVVGVPEQGDFVDAKFRYRVGKDKNLRLTPMHVKVFFASGEQLFGYGCSYNFLENTLANESTHEIFYDDVVSVTANAEQQMVVLPFLGIFNSKQSQIFSIVTSGATALRATVTFPEIAKKLKAKSIVFPKSDAEGAISKIRKAVRLKKSEKQTTAV